MGNRAFAGNSSKDTCPVSAPLFTIFLFYAANYSVGIALLIELAKIKGIYVPALYEVTYKADGTIDEENKRKEATPHMLA